MKRYFIDNNGNRCEVTEANMYEYLNVKDNQWFRIWDTLRTNSGEQKIEAVKNELESSENALESDMDRWNNHRAEVYAEWCTDAGWTKAQVDKDWTEHFDDLRKEIVELKNKLTVMEIDLCLKCRYERTAKSFMDRFGWRRTFKDRLESKVRRELNI